MLFRVTQASISVIDVSLFNCYLVLFRLVYYSWVYVIIVQIDLDKWAAV